MCRGALEFTLTGAGQTAGVDDFISFLPFCDHLSDDLRRILQIGIHDDDCFSGGHVHSRCDRNLMTEIPRQSDVAVAWIAPNKRFQDDGAAIRAAVINEDRFSWSVQLLHQDPHAPQKDREGCLLVEHRHDDAVANACKMVRHGNFHS